MESMEPNFLGETSEFELCTIEKELLFSAKSNRGSLRDFDEREAGLTGPSEVEEILVRAKGLSLEKKEGVGECDSREISVNFLPVSLSICEGCNGSDLRGDEFGLESFGKKDMLGRGRGEGRGICRPCSEVSADWDRPSRKREKKE